ncbi:MAG: serine/threonine protein kinase [Verrucomicrobia bacterium]|nr:MAG: serine/threonine protein kinase [Verrucomicrobiota bacterium]
MSQPSFNAPELEVLGRLLPAFDFECLIAKGGMGAVYKAKQRSLGRDVAIKILPPEVGHDPLLRHSFETEARAMARLNHPNLIAVYDSGAVEDMLYIIMEYVPGKSLYHSSYGQMIEPVQAVQLIQGICAGLSHAHEHGMIHSDIKPANILLTPKTEAKIGDFGLVRLAGSEGTGLVMGTPGYAAPEVLANPLVADHRSDIFAVGVILYELLTGQRQEPGAPLPSSLCGCSIGLDDIWRRATHLNPASRFQSAADFSAALAEWSVANEAPAKRRGTGPGGNLKPMANVASQVQPRRQGSGVSTLLQFLALAGLIGISAYLWKARLEHDKEMVKVAEKNAQTVEELKQLQGGAPRTPRTSAGSTIKPVSPPVAPYQPTAITGKVGVAGNESEPHPGSSGSTAAGVADVTPAESAALATLSTKAKDLIVAIDKKRAEQLAANAKVYLWELDRWLHTLPNGVQATWQPQVAKFKEVVRESRVPVVFPRLRGLAATPPMLKILTDCAAKQEQIDSTFLAETDKLRVFYLSRLKVDVATAERSGHSGEAATLRAAYAEAAGNEAWLRSFGIDPRPVAPKFAKDPLPTGNDPTDTKAGGGN